MIEDYIKKEGNTWVLYSKYTGKPLGTFKTKKEALKRGKQIVMFKFMRIQQKTKNKKRERKRKVSSKKKS